MRILLVHNYYQQPGGEDVVFAAEGALLRQHNHEVIGYVAHNHEIDSMNRLTTGLRAVWSQPARNQIRALLRSRRPDVVHFHNTFPLVSPAAYSACHEEGVAVVQTLHNYRLICANGIMFRGGRPCEDCVGWTPPWPAVAHSCYRESFVETAAVAAMLTFHRLRRTWHQDVDIYIALTDSARQRYIAGGLPARQLAVKPNFVECDPLPKSAIGDFFLFAGRLDLSKGVEVLLRAWTAEPPLAPLKVIGDGVLAGVVRSIASSCPSIRCRGRLERPALIEEMRGARALIVPSLGYEVMPLIILEAFATGLPVIASRLGAMADLVDDGRTGMLFTPGDPVDLAAKVRWAWEHPDEIRTMGALARREYETRYTAELNYQTLMHIYNLAIERARCARAKVAGRSLNPVHDSVVEHACGEAAPGASVRAHK